MHFIRHFALLVMALAFFWLGGYLIFAAWVANMKPADIARPTDAVIVLTGGARRVTTGLDLLAGGHAPQLYISGVNNAVSLKDIMNHWGSDIKEKDAAACCIILDHKAQNTAQNATETADWVRRENIRSLRLVTSNYHMPRAWLEFKTALPETEILPHPVLSIRKDLGTGKFWTTTFIEYHKTLLTLIRTRFWLLFHPKGIR